MGVHANFLGLGQVSGALPVFKAEGQVFQPLVRGTLPLPRVKEFPWGLPWGPLPPLLKDSGEPILAAKYYLFLLPVTFISIIHPVF